MARKTKRSEPSKIVREKAIGYIRVSTEEQSLEGFSLQAQAESIKAYCSFKNLDLIEILTEEVVSGRKELSDRKEGSKLVKLTEGKSEDLKHIVIYKLDRMFRDAANCLNITKEWDSKGYVFHIVDIGGETLNTSSSTGRFFLTILAGLAEMEVNLIRERTIATLTYKKKQMMVYGRTPYGYDRIDDRLVENEFEKDVIELIKFLKKQGYTNYSVACKLTYLGVPTKNGGEKWHQSTVKKIVENNIHGEVIDYESTFVRELIKKSGIEVPEEIKSMAMEILLD